MRRIRSARYRSQTSSGKSLPAWAATEVEGVDSMAGNITNELVGKLGMKNLSKGVKVDVTEEHVSVSLSLNLKYGYSHPQGMRGGPG